MCTEIMQLNTIPPLDEEYFVYKLFPQCSLECYFCVLLTMYLASSS